MEKKPLPSLRITGMKFGLLITVAMGIYLIVMRLAGLSQYTEFRLANYLILAGGMYYALYETKEKHHKHRVNYLPGLGLGFFVGFFSSVFFAIFLFFYTTIDKGFIPLIINQLPHVGPVSPFMVAVEQGSEIMTLMIVINLMVLMLFKRNRIRKHALLDKRNVMHSH